MRFKGLLAASVALAVLGGLVWWSNKSMPEGGAKQDAQGHDHGQGDGDAPVMMSLKKDDIRKVEIRRAEGEVTVVSREGTGGWMITEPKKYAADPDAMTALVGALSDLHAEKLVDEQAADFSPYGLKEPSVAVTATLKDGKTHTVMVGDETPAGGGFYVRTGADKRLFTVAGFTKAGIDKTAADLRDKRLLTFGKDFVTKVEIVGKAGAIEFAHAGQDQWQIVKPAPMRADGWQVDELLRKLVDAKLDATVSDEAAKRNEAAFAGAAVVATVKVTDLQGTQTLEVRKGKDGLLVKSSAVEGVHALAADALAGIEKTAMEFRSKKLFDFGFTEPSKVEVTAGGRTRVFAKSGETWAEGGKTMDSIGVQSLIDRLRDLTAAGFPAKGGGQAEMMITVQAGKGSERVAVTKAGEKYYAVREGEQAVYEITGPDVEALRQAAADVKASQPKPAEKK